METAFDALSQFWRNIWQKEKHSTADGLESRQKLLTQARPPEIFSSDASDTESQLGIPFSPVGFGASRSARDGNVSDRAR